MSSHKIDFLLFQLKTAGMIPVQAKVKINPNQKSYADMISDPVDIKKKTVWQFGTTTELKEVFWRVFVFFIH